MKVTSYFKSPLIDKKIGGKSWMAIMTIGDYLQMVSLFDNPFQRSLLKVKSYNKLIEDLLDDTTIPPISVVHNDINLDLDKEVDTKKGFAIIDGLQRTNCLLHCQEVIKNGKSHGIHKTIESFNNKKIYVEIWEKLPLKSILYKMVVLNTGQRKMDYSHQLDILNNSLQEQLSASEITVLTNKEIKEGRLKSGSFDLASVTEGLVSFINTYPISGKKNAAEFLFERFNISLNSDEEEDNTLKLINDDETYWYLVWVLKDLNNLLYSKYNNNNPIKKYNIFLVSLMAALGYCYKKNPINLKRKVLLLQNSFALKRDPLKLEIFEGYYNKFNANIGEKRRKFIYETFRAFLLANEEIDQLEWDDTYERFF